MVLTLLNASGIMNTVAQRWAFELGLMSRPLFPQDEKHAVLRDGVWGSFVVGQNEDAHEPIVDWSWSAYARHHLSVEEEKVGVINVATSGTVEWFSRKSVEGRLDEFYDYLRRNAKRPTVSVVDHLSTLLHKHLAEMTHAGLSQSEGFLFFLVLLEKSIENSPHSAVIPTFDAIEDREKAFDLLKNYDAHSVRFAEEMEFCQAAGRKLDTNLAFRHASGPLFQSSHHIVEGEGQKSLIGMPSARGHRDLALQGVHYTPVSLARILVAMALKECANRNELVILDPTCGSGVFLVEALYELQRLEFKGKLRLIGMDLSFTATLAARFSVGQALKQGVSFPVEVTIRCGDALELMSTVGLVDCVLMNPPFVSWERMDSNTRGTLKSFLGDSYSRRPDLAMIFVTLAHKQLLPGGRLASVLPTGVMSGDSARKWRDELAGDRLLFDGLLADHQLFEDATVSVGAVLLEKVPVSSMDSTTLLWADNQPSSSDDALRYLKKSIDAGTLEHRASDHWGVFPMNQKAFRAKRTWRPPTGQLSNLLERLSIQHSTSLGDCFAIRLGIRTGNRAAFVVDESFFRGLSAAEKKCVRPIAESSNISAGTIHSGQWVIMIPKELTVEEFSAAYPKLFAHLFPYKEELERRSSIPRGTWWTLSRMRDLHESNEPRLVSKAFFRSEGFAIDYEGRFAVVTGYSWQPYWSKFGREFGDRDTRVRALKVLLNVLDSDLFYLLAREHSSLVSGGQVDLAPAQIDPIPFPLIQSRIKNSVVVAGEFNRMSTQPKTLPGEYLQSEERNKLAAALFDIPLEEWPLPER